MKERRDALTIMNDMVEGLIQAEGGCTQLIQHYRNPKLFVIRDSLSLVKDMCFKLAPHNQLVKPKKINAKTGKVVV